MSRIFVNIASYRDPLLEKTIRNLFDTKSPNNNIFIGVFEQTVVEDSLESTAPDLINRMDVRYKRIDPKHGMGVGWARFNNALQYKDEDYYFQVDSHMQFDQDWDEKLIEDFKMASEKHGGTNKIIISAACKNFEIIEDRVCLHTHPTPKTTRVRYFDYDKGTNLLAAHGDMIEGTNDVEPAIHICAGNLFTHGNWVEEVGPDARMYFSGEEQMLVLQSFLAGYHIYHPREMITYHFIGSGDYITKVWKEPVISEQEYGESVEKSYKYWNRYLKSVSKKDLKKFYEYSGVDYINQSLDERAKTYSIQAIPVEERKPPEKTPWGTPTGHVSDQPKQTELIKMPGSVGKFNDLIYKFLEEIKPTSILDVGVGAGSYGKLIKNIYPNTTVTGIEPTESYIGQYNLDQVYDSIHVTTIQEYIKGDVGIHDVVLCIDVLEHLFLSEAIDMLEALTYHSKWIILAWPNDVNQNWVDGNYYEKHKSNMVLSDLQRFDVHQYKKVRLESSGRQNYNFAVISGMHSSYYK
jgi:2-polyprenyl-3-methyl-5-hydroxy-6-metoxy-1,4-benzoquinol methylase